MALPPGPRIATRIVLCGSGDLPESCRLRSTAREIPVMIVTQEGNEPKLAGWVADGCEAVALPLNDNDMSVDGARCASKGFNWGARIAGSPTRKQGFFSSHFTRLKTTGGPSGYVNVTS